MSTPQRILGIDPGFGRIGFGVIEEDAEGWHLVTYGLIETSAQASFVDRMVELHDSLKDIIMTYRPTSAAVEELFFNKNVTTALQVGQARGVILLTLVQANLPVAEFTPLEVKQTITGYGRAEKKQVQQMVQVLLKMNKQNVQDDAADALAVALTGAAVIHSWDVKKS